MSTIKWKGGNGSFSQASNWTGGVVPGVNDVANITAAGTYTVTATGVNINTVDVGSGVTFSAAPGTAVTTSAVNNSGTIDIGSGGSLFVRTLTNDGTLELDGTLSETFLYLAPAAGQTVTTVSGSGQIVLAKGDGSNEIYFESATGDSVNLDQPVSGSGTITSNIPTTVNLNAGAVISTDQLIGLTISKNIEINANGHSIEATNSGDIDIQGTVTNANILTYGAGSTIAIDGGVIINSMLDTQNLSDPNLRDDIETSTSATLEGINGGALTNDGLFTTGPGGTLNLSGTIDNQGTFDFENGSTLNLTSSVIINDFGKITLEGADQIKATSLETRLTINSTVTTATGGNNVIGNGNIILDNEATIDADGIKGEVSLQLNHILDPRNIGLTQAASFNGGTLEATNDGSLIVEPYQGMYNGQDAIVSWFYNNGTMAAMSGGQVDMLSNLVLQNLSNGTLTGGTYESQGAGSVLLFNQAVTTDAATIILSGAGSRIVTNDFTDPVVDIEKELTTIAAGGKLEIQGNRNYTTNNSISLAGADTSGDAGGLLSLVGGTFSSGTITGAAGSRLLGYGTITSAIVENGLISAEFGTLTLAGATTLDGTVAVIRNDAPAALVVTGDVTGTGVVNLTGNVSAEFGGNASGQIVNFSGLNNTLKLDTTDSIAQPVSGFQQGDTIDFTNIAYQTTDQVVQTVGTTGSTVQIEDGSGNILDTLNFSGSLSGNSFHLTTDGNAGLDLVLVSGPATNPGDVLTTQIVKSPFALTQDHYINDRLTSETDFEADNTIYFTETVTAAANGSSADVLNAGAATEAVVTLQGGIGADTLNGSTSPQGAAILIGGSGANVLNGGSGFDTLFGGGESLLNAGASNQQLLGGYSTSSSDTLNAGSGNSEFLATVAGHDLLKAGSGTGGFLEGGTGADTLTGSTSSTGSAILVAGTGANLLEGGLGADTLVGGGASSLLAGIGSSQLLLGGFGSNASDTLNAGSNNATLGVAAGNNILLAGTGNASLFGGSGNDLLQGGGGTAALVGGSGASTLQAGSGADFLVGGGRSLEIGGSGAKGISVLTGGYFASAHDTLQAGTGSGEILAVVTGNNSIFADKTSLGVGDVLYAGTGNDTLYGAGYGNSAATGSLGVTGYVIGAGNSTVNGGAGNDIIAITNGTGSSSVDGGGGFNVVYFTGHASTDVTNTTTANGVTTITFGGGQSASLSNIAGVQFTDQQTSHPLT